MAFPGLLPLSFGPVVELLRSLLKSFVGVLVALRFLSHCAILVGPGLYELLWAQSVAILHAIYLLVVLRLVHDD